MAQDSDSTHTHTHTKVSEVSEVLWRYRRYRRYRRCRGPRFRWVQASRPLSDLVACVRAECQATTAEELLRRAADVNLRDISRNTPLHYATG